MNTARMAESDMAAQNGCTAEVHLSRLQNNCFMKRKVLKLVILSEKERSKTASRGICMIPPPILSAL